MTADKRPADDDRVRRPGMLDLPLRPGTAPPREPPPRAGAPPPGPGPGWAPERRARRSHPGRWIAAVLFLLAGALAAWFILRPTPAEAVFSPSDLSFEEHRVGTTSPPQELTLANRGERPMLLTELRLAGEAAEDFAVVRDECTGVERATGESCAVAIRFEPRAAGERRATLELVGNLGRGPRTAPIRGRGAAPVMGLDVSELDFGSQQVGSASGAKAVEVANLGSAPLAMSRSRLDGDAAGEFTLRDGCSRETVAPGRTCRVEVAFRPRSAGDKLARIEISGEGGEPQFVALAGSGVWSGPALDPAPAALDFGEQRVGVAGPPRESVLTNRSAAPATVARFAGPATGSGFAVDGSDCLGRALAVGASCRLRVTFTPAADGPVAAEVAARMSEGADTRVALRGTGVSPRLTVEPASLDFGDLRAGARGVSRRVVLANPGRAPLVLSRVTVGGPGARLFELRADSCSGTTVPPNGSCGLEVHFRPTEPGIARAELAVTSDAPGGARTVSLAGRGTAPALDLDRRRLDFGDVLRGAATSRDLVLASTGSAPLEVSALRIEGEDRGDFQVAEIRCRLDDGLAPGRRCQLSVRFRPTAAGPRSAKLVLRHDAASSPDEVWLFGTASEPLPGFELSQIAFRFGDVGVGLRGGIQTLVVRNPGAGRLAISGVSLSGADPEDFAVVPGTCEGAPAIAPQSSCTIGLRFAPLSAGDRRAVLVIRHNAPGGSGEVTLTGRGVGAPDGPR